MPAFLSFELIKKVKQRKRKEHRDVLCEVRAVDSCPIREESERHVCIGAIV